MKREHTAPYCKGDKQWHLAQILSEMGKLSGKKIVWITWCQ